MPEQAKQKNAKKPPQKKSSDAAFVVSGAGGVFEHVSDDLEDEDAEESVYTRDTERD